jgi:AraC-like DNA-binding protein
MKPFLEQVDIGHATSIKVKTYVRSRIDVPLHYHPEHEIVLVVKAKGTVLVSESSVPFEEGDLFLIGGHLPHLFLDERKLPSQEAEVVVIQFRKDLFDPLAHLPEFYATSKLLLAMQHGIKIPAAHSMQNLVLDLTGAEGIEKFNRLSALLDAIVRKGNYQVIADTLAREPARQSSQRLYELDSFLRKYYNRDIKVEEAAATLHLEKSSFCRFVKKETGKTFSELLNQTRINAACQLLRETALTTSEISYETGYNNPAYFYKQFKLQRGLSPTAYKQQFTRAISS